MPDLLSVVSVALQADQRQGKRYGCRVDCRAWSPRVRGDSQQNDNDRGRRTRDLCSRVGV